MTEGLNYYGSTNLLCLFVFFLFEIIVGDFIAEGPPVPIPNTEVKLCYGKDTWLETAWENSSSLTLPMQPKVALFAFTGYRNALIPP